MKAVWIILVLCIQLSVANQGIDVFDLLNKVQNNIDANVAVRSLEGNQKTKPYKSNELYDTHFY